MSKLSDIELERKVLSVSMLYPKAYNQVATKLSFHLFTTDLHKRIYELIKTFSEDNKPYDLIVLHQEMERKSQEDANYLLSISSYSPSSAQIEVYVMYLVELSVKRDFLFRFSNLINLAKNPDTDIFDLRDKTFEYIDHLFLDNFIEANKSTQTFSNLVNQVQNRFMNIAEGNEITGIKSSLNIINKVLGGWQDTNLTILAGRPGMGKSSFMVQQIVDVVLQNKAVGVFSLEMSDEQIASKIITNITQIPNSSILRKGLSKEQIKHFFYRKEDLVQLKIHIDDTPEISIQNLKLKAKMMKMRFNIDILMVDYLQLITFDKASNREQKIANISRGLKSIAKDLQIPVIALSQLSRKVEQRQDKRPLLSDLRDSGAIEQDADEVLFLYRPQFYGIENWIDYNDAITVNEAEIIIQKNRHGGILSERVRVDMPTSRFMNL